MYWNYLWKTPNLRIQLPKLLFQTNPQLRFNSSNSGSFWLAAKSTKITFIIRLNKGTSGVSLILMGSLCSCLVLDKRGLRNNLLRPTGLSFTAPASFNLAKKGNRAVGRNNQLQLSTKRPGDCFGWTFNCLNLHTHRHATNLCKWSQLYNLCKWSQLTFVNEVN